MSIEWYAVSLLFLVLVLICGTCIHIADKVWPNKRELRNLDNKLNQVLNEFKVYDSNQFKILQEEVKGLKLAYGLSSTLRKKKI